MLGRPRTLRYRLRVLSIPGHQNPTLTILALTARACDHALRAIGAGHERCSTASAARESDVVYGFRLIDSGGILWAGEGRTSSRHESRGADMAHAVDHLSIADLEQRY